MSKSYSKAPFWGSSSEPAHAKPKPVACGPKPIPGPGGRRGFYSRPNSVSTTFSRKIRFFQPLEKRLKNQRDFARSKLLRNSRGCLRIATTPPYRFASQASSACKPQPDRLEVLPPLYWRTSMSSAAHGYGPQCCQFKPLELHSVGVPAGYGPFASTAGEPEDEARRAYVAPGPPRSSALLRARSPYPHERRHKRPAAKPLKQAPAHHAAVVQTARKAA